MLQCRRGGAAGGGQVIWGQGGSGCSHSNGIGVAVKVVMVGPW